MYCKLHSYLKKKVKFFVWLLVQKLYDIISQSLDTCDSAFNLYVTPPMSILDPQKTFWGSSLSPASVVYITVKSPAAGTTANAKSLALKKPLLEAAKPFPIPENAPYSGEARRSSSMRKSTGTRSTCTGEFDNCRRLLERRNMPGSKLSKHSSSI